MQDTAARTASHQTSFDEYERVSKDMVLSGERLAKLAADIATVKKDSVELTAALIQSAKTEQKLSEDIEVIEQRLAALKIDEAKARAALLDQRGVLVEVLAALERMGLNPPPAILVKPDDALASVRSAILLGAVVPELRTRTDTMMADLERVSRLTTTIAMERDQLRQAVEVQLVERRKLALLVEEKRKLRHESEAALATEQAHAAELAAKAKSLKELVESLAASAALERAKPSVAEPEPDAPEVQKAALPLPDANLLVGSQPFGSLVGQVSFPASGKFLRRFGQKDGNGGVMQGDTLGTQSDAIVTAPVDGNILYAGPFRSYGQLLILDVGNGYHVLLAGMNRINVAPGQSVLAGEPVGAMGDIKVASATGSVVGTAGQELYIEFRKDGKPVDPAPWWAKRLSGRTNNDT